MSASTVTALVEKTGGRFKVTVGQYTAFNSSATCGARAAGAKHFGVPEWRIEVGLVGKRLAVNVAAETGGGA